MHFFLKFSLVFVLFFIFVFVFFSPNIAITWLGEAKTYISSFDTFV